MIPQFNLSGVLPPYVGTSPAASGGMSPYATSIEEIAQQLCTNEARRNILRGFINYRKTLKSSGIVQGVQWVNGSFCEDVEKTLGRPPADLDVVTLFLRPQPHASPAAWPQFISANTHIFDRVKVKQAFNCDVYYVDIALAAGQVMRQITYWFGLFTHQRMTYQWKGVLAVPISGDDDTAMAHINALNFGP